MTSVSEPTTTVFEGNKFFWRTRNVVDVFILHNSVYDVIVYEPTLNVEAPRLYLNSDALMTLIDEVEIEAKLSFAIRNGIPMTDKLIQKVQNGVVSEFILARLLIRGRDSEKNIFTMELQIKTAEILAGVSLLCPPPACLCPYQTHHFRNLKDGEVNAALNELQQETKDLHDTTENAAALAGLTVRERWRIPLVMGKVIRGQRLRKPDAKIFSHVKANMKTDEVAARMKNTLRVDASCARTVRSTSRLPHATKSLARSNSSLFTATASSLHKTASSLTPTSRRSERSVKSVHHKRSSKTATSTTKAALARKKSKLQASAMTADCGVEGTDSNVNRILSGLSQLSASLRANLGFQATSSKKGESVSPHTPKTVRYNAQEAGLSKEQDEVVMYTACPTPAATDLTPVGKDEQAMSFDDNMAGAYLSPTPREHEAQARQLQLFHPTALAAYEDVIEYESAAGIRPKPTKRSSVLSSFLLAFTAGMRGSFGTVSSQKEASDRTVTQRTSFLHTGLPLWGFATGKVVPEE